MNTQQLFRPLFLGLLAVGIAAPALAQEATDGEDADKRVRINIVTDDNGERTEINEEREIGSEADVDAILQDLGIEIGNLDKGERVEINIRKSSADGEEDIDIDISSAEDGELVKTKAFLGVMLRKPSSEELEAANLSGDTPGAYITEIIEGTKAEETELQAGDIITGLDGKPVANYDEAVKVIGSKNAGDAMEITYVRAGETQTTTATLGERKQTGHVVWTDEYSGEVRDFQFHHRDPAHDPHSPHYGNRDLHFFKMQGNANKAFLGVTPGAEGENGVGIDIVDGTAASEMGLQDGDVIRSINGTTTPNFDVLSETLGKFEAGDEVTIEYERAGAVQTATGALKARPEPKSEKFEFNLNGNDFKWKGCREGQAPDVSNKAFLGVSPGDDVKKGVMIGNVTNGSPAEKMGLEDGDVILEMNGEKVSEWGGLVDVMNAAAPGDEMEIVYKRDGKKATAQGPLAPKSECCKSGPSHCYSSGFNNGNFEFNFDGESMEVDVQEVLRHALEGLEESGELSEEQLEEIRTEIENASREIERTVRIVISVDEVTAEEAEDFNRNTNQTLPLENNLRADAVTVFPNPSMGQVNLNFTLPESGSTTVQVFNKAGETMFLETLSDFQGVYSNQIDLSDRAQGTYFVKVEQNGKSFTKKIIKQ